MVALHLQAKQPYVNVNNRFHITNTNIVLRPPSPLSLSLTAVHFFLCNDLNREHLSKENEEKRRKYLQALDTLVNKIQSAHPSIRPRMNTPAGTVKSPVGGRKPPVAPPPPEEGELYVECDQQEEAEEYLAFEPSSDIPQEVYEAMEPTEEDVGQEVYEEPGECLHMLASFVPNATV